MTLFSATSGTTSFFSKSATSSAQSGSLFGQAAPVQTLSVFGQQSPTQNQFSFNAKPQTTFGTVAPFSQTNTSQPSFGAAATSVSQSFGFAAPQGGFSSAANTLNQTGTSQSVFGAQSTSTPLSSFGFGTAQTNLSGTTFGNPANTSLNQTGTTQSIFGTPNNSGVQSSFGFVGAQTNLPGSTFGNPVNTSFSNNVLGASQVMSQEDLFIESISRPSLFGDERDSIIARWNQLQAMWGSGCGHSSKGKAIYTDDNYLARFKGVSYNEIPRCDDSEGYVSLLVRQSHELVSRNTTLLHEKLHQMINNSSLSISIVDVRPAMKAFINNNNNTNPVNQHKFSVGFGQPVAPAVTLVSNTSNEDLCDVFIKVTENMPNGPSRVVPSSQLTMFLKAEPLKSKLQSDLFVIDVVPQLSANQKEIHEYLNGLAPRGLDVELWERAKQQCPNQDKLLPVPVIGLSELKSRINGQVEFAQSQLNTIRKETETVSEMKTKVVMMSGMIDQLKRKQTELSNRILKVMCSYEIIRKQGYSLSAEEEALKCSLDKLWSKLVGSYGIKSRLQEIMSTSAMNTMGSKLTSKLSYNSMGPESMNELTEYFSEKQQSIKEMMAMLKEDMECVAIINRQL